MCKCICRDCSPYASASVLALSCTGSFDVSVLVLLLIIDATWPSQRFLHKSVPLHLTFFDTRPIQTLNKIMRRAHITEAWTIIISRE